MAQTLYIFSTKNDELIDTIDGESNNDCETKAAENYSDTDYYYWSYTK